MFTEIQPGEYAKWYPFWKRRKLFASMDQCFLPSELHFPNSSHLLEKGSIFSLPWNHSDICVVDLNNGRINFWPQCNFWDPCCSGSKRPFFPWTAKLPLNSNTPVSVLNPVVMMMVTPDTLQNGGILSSMVLVPVLSEVLWWQQNTCLSRCTHVATCLQVLGGSCSFSWI